MKYALMIYDSEESLSAMGDQMEPEYEKFGNTLLERGLMRGGEKLAAPTSSTILRDDQGKVIIHEGPFAETIDGS